MVGSLLVGGGVVLGVDVLSGRIVAVWDVGDASTFSLISALVGA